jgi:hypothetical protein
MDLNQSKLTKTEWESTEIPVHRDEKEILNLIIKGYHDVNMIYNKNESMINFLRLDPNVNVMNHLYKEYFEPIIKKLSKKYDFVFNSSISVKIQRVNSVEKLKLDNLTKTIQERGHKIFEFYLLHICESVMKYFHKSNIVKTNKSYYTLQHLNNLKITNVSPKVREFVENILADYYVNLNIEEMFKQSSDLIEQNDELTQYKDFHLYEHQKELFTISKTPEPKMILYIAPTGTGKTLSPLGLSETHRVIFVCAARHVGLALARSAVSVGKKVAFAFGCHDVSDIRLHYFAVKDYVKSEKTGKDIKYRDGKRKVDNTNGSNVEIMICDIKSYLSAMYYMAAFHEKDKMIMYWDEPTITMDYEEHEFHSYISEIWQKNVIPNIIMSSATLPHEEDLQETISDYKSRFENSKVYNIVSHDCNKSIPIINSANQVEMPHLKYGNYDDLQKCAAHCQQHKTLLRYFDLGEIVQFIHYLDKNDLIPIERYKIREQYDELINMTMNNIKIHYLEILQRLSSDKWESIYQYFQSNREEKYKSNIYIATQDAHTLTDGPTIFLADDVEKISKFILQTAKIPAKILSDMTEAIEYNDKLLLLITEKEHKLEDSLGDEVEKEHKMAKNIMKPEERALKKELDELSKMIKTISLHDLFVPNKLAHLRKWVQKDIVEREFACDIQQSDVEKIMLLRVSSTWKLLLLMGIGVFTNNHDPDYTEVMKQLAVNQKLYLIIASSDYIYGTNYQFCHGYISKDLNYMTQEKTIQALGRIGRNQLSKEYSIRFRDDVLIEKIFTHCEHRPEVENMNKLFNTPLV